ncbi:GGDEF domain-containing protein [Vibrio lamellibrachiae]|uniref:GGDEF domain-containing protein n=1 Tax=Vibrio lamellibrachiae TaxID=2910253 RepID=UPI003D0B05DC
MNLLITLLLLMLFSAQSFAKKVNIDSYWWQTPNATIIELEQETKRIDAQDIVGKQLFLAYLYQRVGRDNDAKSVYRTIQNITFETPLQRVYSLALQAAFTSSHSERLPLQLKAISVAESAQLPYHHALSSIDLAHSYLNLGKYIESLAILQKTNKVIQTQQLPLLADINNAFGLYYFYTKQVDLAERHYLSAIQQAKSAQNMIQLHQLYHNLYLLYSNVDKPEQAEQAINDMFKQSELTKLPIQLIYSYLAKIDFSIKQQKFEQALGNVLEAEKLVKNQYSFESVSNYLFLRALTYAELNQQEPALLALQLGKEFVQKEDGDDLMLIYHRRAAHIYQLLGLYKQAYESLDQYSHLHQQADDKQQNKMRAEMEVVYEVERKDLEAALLSEKNRVQELELRAAEEHTQIYYLAFTGSALLLVMTLFFLNSTLKNRALLRIQANRDPLTNVNNRRFYDDSINKLWLNNSTQPFSIISVDIDHFKSLNDNYGHAFGDQVLIQVAKQIVASVKAQDIVARVGGEEFSIILPDVDLEAAKPCAERIRETIAKHNYPFQGENIQVTISLGLTHSSLYNHPDDMFKYADRALYQAKSSGRNCLIVEQSDHS